jgi:hypothetical protein
MKFKKLYSKFTILFIFSIFFQSYGQFEFLKIENGQIVFEKIYDLKGDIKKSLISDLKQRSYISEIQVFDDFLTCKLKNINIDYTRYGANAFNVHQALRDKFFCDINIDWKTDKYKVTVNNMYFASDGLLGNQFAHQYFTRENKFIDKPSYQKACSIIEKCLAESFIITKKKDW